MPTAAEHGLGEVVSRQGLKQLRLAETENTRTSPTFLMVGLRNLLQAKTAFGAVCVKTYDQSPPHGLL